MPDTVSFPASLAVFEVKLKESEKAFPNVYIQHTTTVYRTKFKIVIFEVYTAVTMKNAVFWEVRRVDEVQSAATCSRLFLAR
jgi:hypothetical protein